MILWDMSDYYEAVKRAKLQEQHRATHFPGPVATLSLQQYGGERLLQLGQATESCGHPTDGILPGCTVATYHVQAHSGPGISDVQSKHPQLAINVHVDDVCTSAVATSEAKVVSRLTAGARDILALVEGELGCQISEQKAAVVASSKSLQQQLVRELGRLGGRTLLLRRQIWG